MPDTHHHPCTRERLAAGEFSLVELCDCGALHLTIGAVTMRLAPTMLPVLADVLHEAARELVLHDLIAARRAPAGALS